jgi:hypothetical protein
MNFKMLLAAGGSALAIALAAPASAFAQDAAPIEQGAGEAPMAAPALDVTDETLQSFAVAFLQVAEISQEYQPQLESAASPEEQDQVRIEAGERMIQAVEQADGITVDEYQGILQAAQTDPELAQRINTQIAQLAQ